MQILLFMECNRLRREEWPSNCARCMPSHIPKRAAANDRVRLDQFHDSTLQ